MQAAPIQVETVRTDALHPSATNARTHSKKQIKQIADSIMAFGFLVAILALRCGRIVSGHGRWHAAQRLGLEVVPVVYVDGLSEAQVRAFAIADNRIAEKAGWNEQILATEIIELDEAGIKLDVTGFSISERDIILQQVQEASPAKRIRDEDRVVEMSDAPVTRPGDLWRLERHRLFCGSALEALSYERLMIAEKARMAFTDSPYNVPIGGFTGGLGRTKHPNFAMASGEMSPQAFTEFLKASLGLMAANCVDGAILFACMDWRHISELLSAASEVGLEYKQLIVWETTNAGMGTFYRSQHELIPTFKVGTAPHCNTFGLGDTGRSRSNVWRYAGVNSFRKGRMQELQSHPTSKPVALVRDAILDVSERGDVVLDPFGGSGTTLIAAHSCGRTARLVELEPKYCDVTCRRFAQVTGEQAVRDSDGLTFDEVESLQTAASTREAA